MHFKLIIAFIEDSQTDAVMAEARASGATGATVINNARGEGLKRRKTFFGLELESQRDVVLFVVEEHMSRQILEAISRTAGFDEQPGRGMALLVNIEDAVGVAHQAQALSKFVEGEI